MVTVEDVVDTLWSEEVAVVTLFSIKLFMSLKVTIDGVDVEKEGERTPE